MKRLVGIHPLAQHLVGWLRTGKFTSATIESYARNSLMFIQFIPDDIHQLKLEHIERAIMAYSRNKAPGSINLYIATLQSLFRYLHKQRVCDNFGDFLQYVPYLPPKRRVVSRAEYLKICDCENIEKYKKDIFVFLCNSGLRAEEFCSLTPYNFSDGFNFVRIIGKGRKNRSIPCNASLKEILVRDPKLTFFKGRSKWWLEDICADVAKTAGVPHINPHACRHYFSNSLFRAKVPIPVISRILGHANSAVTEKVYLEFLESDLKGVTDVLDL